MFKTIKMANPPEGFHVEFWENYGFTASNKTTTNGSLYFLLNCFKKQESRDSVMEFAREVAKTEPFAARWVEVIEKDARFKK